MKIGRINVDLLRDMRDQLWAEAVVLYEAEDPWWMIKKEYPERTPNVNQRDRYIGDPGTSSADYVDQQAR